MSTAIASKLRPADDIRRVLDIVGVDDFSEDAKTIFWWNSCGGLCRLLRRLARTYRPRPGETNGSLPNGSEFSKPTFPHSIRHPSLLYQWLSRSDEKFCRHDRDYRPRVAPIE